LVVIDNGVQQAERFSWKAASQLRLVQRVDDRSRIVNPLEPSRNGI
jgi:hypothetical protein